MKVDIPAKDFYPFALKKMRQLQEELEYHENQIQNIINRYEDRLKQYQNTNWLLRLFKSKPQHPGEGLFTDYDFHHLKKRHLEEEIQEIHQILLVIDQAQIVQLSNRDIVYYGIQSKGGTPNA